MNEDLLNAALAAADRGWFVLPLRPGDKPPALHGERRCTGLGDCAYGHRKWEQRATTDRARIERCWRAGLFNVGIATGPSGLVVVDLDLPKPTYSADTPSGVTTFHALCERAWDAVPDTYRMRTASGGQHLYFTPPAGVRLQAHGPARPEHRHPGVGWIGCRPRQHHPRRYLPSHRRCPGGTAA